MFKVFYFVDTVPSRVSFSSSAKPRHPFHHDSPSCARDSGGTRSRLHIGVWETCAYLQQTDRQTVWGAWLIVNDGVQALLIEFETVQQKA